MRNSTKINSGLIGAAGICQAAALAPIDALPSGVGAVLGIVSVVCALIAGTRIVSEVDAVDAAKDRASRPHRTGIGSIVVGLILVSWSLGGCAAVQDRVEVHPPAYAGAADARVVLPLSVYGVLLVADVSCEVDIDDLRPLCGVCIEVADATVCQCWRGSDRVSCPGDARAP